MSDSCQVPLPVNESCLETDQSSLHFDRMSSVSKMKFIIHNLPIYAYPPFFPPSGFLIPGLLNKMFVNEFFISPCALCCPLPFCDQSNRSPKLLDMGPFTQECVFKITEETTSKTRRKVTHTHGHCMYCGNWLYRRFQTLRTRL